MFRPMSRLLMGLFLCSVVPAARQSDVWLDVPFVRQAKNGCGAASIAMVLQYWQRQQGKALSADPEQIQRALYSPRAHGIYASAMEHYLQQRGFQTFAFAGEWRDIREQLGKGRPLIVALKPGSAGLHYVVLAGENEQQGVVLKNDPAERKLLKQDRSVFEKEWKAAGNWTLLAVPRQQDHGSRP